MTSAGLGLVVVATVVVVLVCAVIVTCENREARQADMERHPSNYRPPTVVVPLVCPRCLVACGEGRLSEADGEVGGFIELRQHHCVAVSA